MEMLNYHLKPSYEYMKPAWKEWEKLARSTTSKKRSTFRVTAIVVRFSVNLMRKQMAKRVKCTILYATETGKSERFAKLLNHTFLQSFDAKILCMKDYNIVADLECEKLLLIVTSTCGNGDAPENGKVYEKKIFLDSFISITF